MTEEKKGTRVEISDIYTVAQYLEVAIKRKTFTVEEVKVMYPSWNNIIKFCEEVKRKADIEDLYKDSETKDSETKDSETKNSETKDSKIEI